MSFYTYTKPIQTTGGIKARTSKSTGWWTARWLDMLSRCIDAGRLSRGKTYARKGQVLDIDITQGLVSASVQGSRRTPYSVRLPFDMLSDDEVGFLVTRCRENISVAAQLMAGKLPETIAEIFDELGAPLFLTRREIKKFKCTCPDDSIPCKHIVAVLVLVAEVIDSDPFLLLKLRGIDKDMLINVITGEHFDSGSDFYDDDSDFFDEDEYCIRSSEELSEETAAATPDVMSEITPEAEPEDLSRWFTAGEFTFEETADRNSRSYAALDIMSDFPFWRGDVPFKTALAPLYEQASANAEEILTGERTRPIGRPRKIQ